MNQFVFLLVLAVFVGLNVNGQVVHHRQCPNHTIMSPFNPAQYSGRWYEIQRYETGTQTDGDCTVSLYTLASPTVFNVQYNMLVGPQPVQINGQSVVSFPDETPLRETAWVLSRQTTIAPPVQVIVNGLINEFLVPALLRPTVQDTVRCGH